jgi:uncharacterized protein (DUF58 family)
MADAIVQYLTEGQQAGALYTLSAPRRAPLGTTGAQLGKSAGESLEFMDHREYQPGDDLRRLDWSMYARSDKMVVKLYRQEVCPHLDILLDGSRSMALEGTEKLRAAVGLAAALATAADNAGHTRRVYLTGAGCRAVANAPQQPVLWQGLKFDGVENPLESLHLMPPNWRPRGVRILISDLLWLGDPLELLSAMSDRAAAVYVIQVLARCDADPPHHGNLRLVDCETGAAEELFLDSDAQSRYGNNLRRHCENWHRAVRQVGGALVSLVAEELVSNWNFSPLVAAEILTL